MLWVEFLSDSRETAFKYVHQDPIDDKLNLVGTGKGLVPSGNKPLLEPMLTQIFVAMWRY